MATASKAKKTGDGGVLGLLRETAIVIVGALIASTLLRMFLVQVFVIPSGSMENTLLIGDRVAVEKVVPFTRGDIVVFRDDLGWLPAGLAEQDASPVKAALTFVGILPDESSNYLIKRAIGLPGDHVVCCTAAGKLTVNGAVLDEESYLYTDPATGEQAAPSEVRFDLVVPQNTVFVMGDHRNDSADSRCHLAQDYNGVPAGLAFVRRESVVGAGFATVFPFDRIGGHGRPATFDAVPAPTGTAPAAPVINGQAPPAC